jgi:hypothetical protein
VTSREPVGFCLRNQMGMFQNKINGIVPRLANIKMRLLCPPAMENLAMMAPPNRLATLAPPPPESPRPGPVECIVGDTICRVRIWTEEEWGRLPAEERPSPAEHVPGVGWVGVVIGRRSD